ncbi:hypothetical protein GF339_18410 [candidate division KSB3 bacterium]|uniref:Alanine--tRNA ligase n=1 Tax=candidate division KSB3 bacterium TaxID=2044937 RepID=A0A9D5Q7L3_9BACT|nr:hypothetical protein [candidate division KSB3 bacterium]MBD3326563.1 hypothetical protein [candidate division KSB3 bacterium]
MTRKLYHEDPYVKTFSATVLEHRDVEGTPGVILDQTAFYPTSGGQPYDTGRLNGVAVVDVLEDEAQQVIHLLTQPLEGTTVEGQIDWERRFDHMQQHTGQHLLSQACIDICEAETVSFHLGEESSTIDVTASGLDESTLQSIENFANQRIYENREVLAHIVTKDEVHRFPVRKLPTVEENIRIVEIKDLDYSPCGGTHCARTGEISMIKIRRVENYKGGTRLHFVCGWRALSDYQQKTEILKQLSDAMSSGEPDLLQNLQKLQDEAKTLRREHKHLTQQMLEYEALALVNEREQHSEIAVLTKLFDNRDPKELRLLATKILEHCSQTVILFGGAYAGKASLIFLRSDDLSPNMGALMKTACAAINGRGGGQPHQAQGGGTETDKLPEALQTAKDALLS